MKAALFNSYGDTGVLQIVDIPRPQITTDEILVRVHAAAVNPKDTFIRKGYLKQFTGSDFPMLLGFDFSGEVVEVGSNVGSFQEGDSVYGMLDGWHGKTCAEYAAVTVNQAALKPDALSFAEAAALPLASSTALQAFRDEANISAGQGVCINGASGGVGCAAVQIAKIYGAQVTAVSRAENHDFLRKLGADSCIDYRDIDITKSDRKFDIFFDVFGNQRFEAIKPILSDSGIWVSTVIQPHVFGSVAATKFSSGRKAKLVIVKSSREDLDIISGWVDSDQLKPIIHSVFPLEQIGDAHSQQETKHTRGKIVVLMS
jgi:NADPH:quinone reductase-like Zn-dependent oxidoreductase